MTTISRRGWGRGVQLSQLYMHGHWKAAPWDLPYRNTGTNSQKGPCEDVGKVGPPDGESAVVGEQTGEEGSRESAAVPGVRAPGQGNQAAAELGWCLLVC